MLKSTSYILSFRAGEWRDIHDPFLSEALALSLMKKCHLFLSVVFLVIIIIMLFIVAFLGILAINRQTDVLLYGSSCVLLCHWLVTSCG